MEMTRAAAADRTEGLALGGWFARRSPAFRQEVMRRVVPRSYEAGETIYHYGDVGKGIYGILDGGVQISAPADDGQERILHRAEGGFWIGDLGSLSNLPRLVTLAAIRPTRAVVLSGRHVEAMLTETPAYWQDFYALSNENTRTALRLLCNLSVVRTDPRLALRLLHLQESAGGVDGWIETSQEAVASMAAMSVPTAQRALHRLAEAGLVELGYRRLRVLDATALRTLSQN